MLRLLLTAAVLCSCDVVCGKKPPPPPPCRGLELWCRLLIRHYQW